MSVRRLSVGCAPHPRCSKGRSWFSATSAALAVFLSTPGVAPAQSFNVDFGPPESAPSASYGAIGRPGTWNTFEVMPSSERFPLVDLAGAASAARIYNIGGTQLLAADDPGTTGDDAALMDDMFIGFNDPIDVCLFFEGLENGDYLVVTYAMTPDDAGLLSRVRVDDGSPGPVEVGGDWPGAHQSGTTFAQHSVAVTDGRLGLHSGLWGAEVQSGVNGLQLIHLAEVGIGTLAPGGSPPLVHVSPNPARATQYVAIDGLEAGTVRIYGPNGRLVFIDRWEGGAARFSWDGRDRAGRPIAAGIYHLEAVGPGGHATQALVRLD